MFSCRKDTIKYFLLLFWSSLSLSTDIDDDFLRRTSCYLRIYFDRQETNYYHLGTGSFIGSNLILTAAHNVQNLQGNIAQRIQYNVQGPDGEGIMRERRRGEILSFLLLKHFNHSQEHREHYDYALLYVKEFRSSTAPPAPIDCCGIKRIELPNNRIILSGYGDNPEAIDPQFLHMQGQFNQYNNFIIYYDLQTLDGMSGSGLISSSPFDKKIVAVHHGGSNLIREDLPENVRIGSFINNDVFRLISNWRKYLKYRFEENNIHKSEIYFNRHLGGSHKVDLGINQ